MKLVSFHTNGELRYGYLADDLIHEMDLGATGLRAILLGGLDAALKAANGKTIDAGAVSLAPPIPDPEKIICVGLNYHEHLEETGRAPVGYPTIFIRFADTQIGHDEPIIVPSVSESVDYEGELAIIIGKPGRNISEQDAFAHVAGYACYNDVSIRDWQRHGNQWTPGKNFPGTGPFGPWIVTADEIDDPENLRIETRVNGETLQSASTSQLIFSIPVLLAYISKFTTLRTGDVICTGTPGGVGFTRTPPIFLKPGDVVEVEIENVGLLKNDVVAETPEHIASL